MALRIRLTKIEEWWQSFPQDYAIALWRRQPEAGFLKASLWLCQLFVTLTFTFTFFSPLFLNLCFLFAREFGGIEEKTRDLPLICLPCDHLQRL